MSDTLDLFDQPPGRRTGHAKALGEEGLERTATKHDGLLEELVPVAQALARTHRNRGVTVTEVRKMAVDLGILTGYEGRNTLSALGALMRRAGLVTDGERRQSDLDSTHARPQVVWRLP